MLKINPIIVQSESSSSYHVGPLVGFPNWKCIPETVTTVGVTPSLSYYLETVPSNICADRRQGGQGPWR